jgi:hypothetical protein
MRRIGRAEPDGVFISVQAIDANGGLHPVHTIRRSGRVDSCPCADCLLHEAGDAGHERVERAVRVGSVGAEP